MTLLTEDEAKTKWCPLARVIPGTLKGDTMFLTSGNIYPHNRVDEGAHEPEATWNGKMACIASACMAWRSEEVANADRSALIVKGYCGAFWSPHI